MADERKLPHCLNLDNRKKLKLNGITDVGSFDEQSIVTYTDLGELIIKGSNLHINKLNLENGLLEIDGVVNIMEYSDDSRASVKGIFSKIFR